MRRMTGIKTRYYTEERDRQVYNIMVTETADMYDAYIQKDGWGDWSYMFGWPKEQHDGHWTYKMFMSLVKGNLDWHMDFLEQEELAHELGWEALEKEETK